MERRNLYHDGTALGTALMTGRLADTGYTDAPVADLSRYQGAITLPGGNSVALTLAVRVRDGTGTLHTEVPFLLERRVRDGAVTAWVVAPYDLDCPAGALAGCADAHGGARGQLTVRRSRRGGGSPGLRLPLGSGGSTGSLASCTIGRKRLPQFCFGAASP